MKKLLFLLLVLAATTRPASYVPNPSIYYTLDNTLVEDQARYTAIVNTGSVPTTNSPAPTIGNQWMGPFGSGTYLSYSAQVNTDVSTWTRWTIYFQNLRVPSLAGNNILLSSGPALFIRGNATGTVDFEDSHSTLLTSAVSITANTNFQLAVRNNGTNVRIYYALAGASTWVDIGTSTSFAGDLTCTNLMIGNYANLTTFPWNGYVGGVMLFNSALDAPPSQSTPTSTVTPTSTSTSTPTMTPTVTATPSPTATVTLTPIQNALLSPYMDCKQMNGPFVSPVWWRP